MLLNTKTHRWIVIVVMILCIGIFTRNLVPFSDSIFVGHDETQAARAEEFALSLQEGHVPPRIAPHFSYGMGYPVFNYYAPLPYWVAGIAILIGMSVASALKLTYLIFFIAGLIGMYYFLRTFFSTFPGLLGALLYMTSPFIAVDIFVRANLGEIAALSLLPWAFYLLKINSRNILPIAAVVLSLLFTAHNILSLVSLGLIGIYIFLIPNRRLNIIATAAGLLLGSYFLIPAILELPLVQATSIATKTNFLDHFVCLNQLWTSNWGYAGSAPGCDADGMSFMVGKIQLFMGFVGIGGLIYYFIKKNHYPKDQKEYIFFVLMTIFSIFLTISASSFIWQLFKPLLGIFQFPWRFLGFTIFGLAFFGGYASSVVPSKYQVVAIVLVIGAVIIMNQKFFVGQMISQREFGNTYLTDFYISQKAAYKVPEYIPHLVNSKTWQAMEKKAEHIDTKIPYVSQKGQQILLVDNKPFNKLFMAKSLTPVIANIHYAPYWNILVDYKPFIPTRFDTLGRPFIPVSPESYTSVQIVYQQTSIEVIGTMVSLVTLAGLAILTYKQFTFEWKTIIKKT